jgi:RNA polymerase sigma-70 factor, ECF subfamily
LIGSSRKEVSLLLEAWCGGNEEALGKLIPFVDVELRRMAHHQIARERTGHTLQTTALVNEAYLRLVGVKQVNCHHRIHFFALSAQLMRRILVDYARAHNRKKRGGTVQMLTLDQSPAIPTSPDANLIELDDALNSLAAIDSRKAKTVELRFFGGLSVEETAKALHVSIGTVMSDWKFAKAWLLRELQHEGN